MKQVLVLMAGSSLLVMLTASSLIGVLRVDGPAVHGAPAHKIDLASVEKHVEETQAELGANEAFVKQLPTVDPLDRGGSELSEAPTERTKKIQAEWKNSQAAIKGLANLSQIYARGSLAVAAEKEKLKSFVDANPLLPGPERDSINRLAEDRIAILTESTQAADQLVELRRLYESGQYPACLRIIGMIRTEALSEENRREIEELKARATFKEYWSKLLRPSKNRDRVQALEKHRGNSKAPMAIVDEEKAYLEAIDVEIAKLKVDIRMEDLEERASAPAITASEMLAECRRVVAENEGFRPRVQLVLRKWFDRKLVAKVTPTGLDKELKETWKKDGRYLRGIFVEQKTPGAFKFWADPEKFKKGAADYLDYFQREFTQDPQRLMELRVTEAFNEARAKLAKKYEFEQSWTEFSETCKQLQKDLDEYYKVLPDTYVSRPSGKLSLTQELEFVTEFLEGWPDAKLVLRP